MGGKTTTSTQSVQIPPEVLARYNAVNARAEQVAQKPFVPYSEDPSAFVAPLTSSQQAGIQNINALQGMGMGDVAAGQGMIGQGAQAGSALQLGSLGAAERGIGVGEALSGEAMGTSQEGRQIGGQLIGSSLAQIAGGQGAGANLYNQSLGTVAGGRNIAGGLYNQSLQTGAGGLAAGTGLFGQSLGTAGAGAGEGTGLTRGAVSDIAAARNIGSGFASDAARNIYAGLGAASPYMAESAGLTRAGLGAGAGYGNLASQYLTGGTGAVGPGELEVSRYMSPYMENVVRAQQALQAEENAAQRSALTGQAIRAGAFGGDRAGIAQANLARQQSLANQATLSNLLQSGYGQALQTAQQQQGQALSAEQANRAAQQFGSQQAAALGQQGFQQALAAAAQQMGLGQALYGQNIGQGQAIQGLGQQQFAQGLGAAQAQGQFGQNIAQIASQNAQLQQAAAQGMFGQAAQLAALQQQVAQGAFGMGSQEAALQQAAAQGIFGQSAQAAALQQRGSELAANQAAQTAALQQQAARDLAALNMQNAQLQQSAGTNLANVGLQSGQATANLGLANQAAQLQAAQAQMAAGQIEQQTEQAAKTAEYNQFLQQQGFPYQQAQFLGNIAMGTGALSGSTTTTTQPSGWSDRRLKENIKKIGETFDGQTIYRYNLKGDPRTQIGLMAQEVEKDNPEAVGRSQGYRTLDYKKATNEAAERGHFYSGGLVSSSMGGVVTEPGAFARGGYADGGDAEENTTQATTAPATANIDPRINQFYDKYLLRKPDEAGAQFWQTALDSGVPLSQIEQDIAGSRERQLVNQQPLTYNPAKYAAREAPILNRYGMAAAPLSSTRSSFDRPAAAPATSAPTAAPTATGKGASPSPSFNRYGSAPSMGYGQPQASGKGPSAPPSYGYSSPSFGYGGGYGGYGGSPSPFTSFGGGGFGGYGGYGGGYGGYGGGYGGYGGGYGGYGGGYSAPTATGKGPVASMATGGRIGKQGGGAALLQQLAAQHMGMYGQMPGAPGTEPLSRIKHTLQMPSAEAQRRFSPGSLPQKPQSGLKTAADMGSQLAGLYKTGKELRTDIKKLFEEDPNKKQVGGGETIKQTTPGGSAPAAASAARQQGASLEQPNMDESVRGAAGRAFSMSDAGSGSGLAPAGSDASSMLSSLGPEESLDALSGLGGGSDFLSAFAARGGRINREAGGRTGYRAGGLPTGLAPGVGIDIPDELPGYKLNEQVPKTGGGGGGGGGSGLGTALAIASTIARFLPSDRRVKENAEVIGKLYDGQKVYRYDFGDGRTELGLMAQEVEKRNPDAVRSLGGLKMVNYDKATSRAHKQGGGGLAGILDGVEYREMPEEERGLAPERVRMAALSPTGTMSDAEPIGVTRGALMAAVSPTSERAPTPPADVAAPPAPRTEERPRAEAPSEPPTQAPERPTETRLTPTDRAVQLASRYTEGPVERVGKKLGVPELMRDERVFVPLIAGIGAMLASDKPRFSQALGEGLAGAAGAYGAVRGQTQDISESEARTRSYNIGAATKSILTDSSGRPWGVLVFDPKTGGYNQMDFGEAYRRRNELNLLPGVRDEMERAVKDYPDLVSGETGTKGAPAPAPTTSTGVKTGPAVAAKTEGKEPPKPEDLAPSAADQKKQPSATPAPVTKIFAPDNEEVARVNAESQKLIGADLSKLPDYYTRAAETAKAAADQRSLLFQFANAYAGLPDKGLMTPGAMAPTVRMVGETLQSTLENVGVPGPMNKEDIGRATTIDKVTAEMKARASSEAGQRSYAAFAEMGARAPTLGTPKPGGAKALASIIVNNQAKVFEDIFAKNLLDKADESNKFNARYTGQVINEMFNRRFGPKLEQDRDAIAKMFTEPVKKADGTILKDPKTNRPINYMQWLSDPEVAKTLNNREKLQIEKKFGEGILLYFPGVRR